jgi:hypothetical protein
MAGHLNRRPANPLNAQAVKAATEPGKHFDGHGLYLLVSKSGAKSWVQRITIRGKRTEIGLGSASLVTLAEARAQHQVRRISAFRDRFRPTLRRGQCSASSA